MLGTRFYFLRALSPLYTHTGLDLFNILTVRVMPVVESNLCQHTSRPVQDQQRFSLCTLTGKCSNINHEYIFQNKQSRSDSSTALSPGLLILITFTSWECYNGHERTVFCWRCSTSPPRMCYFNDNKKCLVFPIFHLLSMIFSKKYSSKFLQLPQAA